jgi:hypothetical protein
MLWINSNIQRSMLTNLWPFASFTSRFFFLKITTLSNEMRHFFQKNTQSQKILYYLIIINLFIIRFVNVNILSLNTPNHTFKVIRYLNVSVVKILVSQSAIHLFWMITSTSIHQQEWITQKRKQFSTLLCYSN